MNAFETELGVMTEIAKAVDDMGWLLPTDVQGEAIPLILGGGDVLMAAETGSGKTGAFCLPVLQVVYETLKEQQSGKKGHKISAPKKTGFDRFHMNVFDRTEEMAIDADGTLCQSRDAQGWHGCRSTRGVVNKGKYYYEAKVTDEGLCRVGWSTDRAALDLGTDKFGFGFGGTGKKSFGKQFDDYGEAYGMSDVIGCLLDLDHMKIKWAKNGKDLGLAFDIPKNLHQSAFYAAVVLKNAEMKFNFGEEPFKYHPGGGYVGLSETSKDCQVESAHCGVSVASSQPLPNAPYCIVIEPSRELAEQTLQQFNNFNRYLDDPRPRALLVVGGTAANQQIQALQNGVDIVVGTPGRMEDLISTGHLSLQQIRFFILDEADGLLGGGYEDMIMRMHRDIPKVTPDGKRLQMIVCSATLHNFQVKKLAERVMHFPTWVDLKGEDTVPETVHHVVCWVNPREDIRWKSLSRRIATDGVHAGKFNPNSADKETLSEAIKILKGEYCVEAIRKHKMDKALIFCRTKLDCDNMEAYFTSLGGGPEASHNHQFSCVCLHADRSPPERKANLDKFKQNKVRFLICTDVAARGLDITGLPFVINVTLPDEKQNYIHRIGRVGRAERMGLAISLAAALPEKVWYHTCPSKGKSCYNTNLREQRGCCIWYNEEQLLAEIEDHLNITIPVVGPAFDIPVNEFDGKVVYGEKKKDTGTGYKGHVDFLAPTVRELAELEKKAQLSFLNFQQMKTFRK